MSALARQIEHDIATGAPGQRTSIPLEDAFVTRSGHILADAGIERTNVEAKRGYDPATLTPRAISWNEQSTGSTRPPSRSSSPVVRSWASEGG
jgi:hypothetical protein